MSRQPGVRGSAGWTGPVSGRFLPEREHRDREDRVEKATKPSLGFSEKPPQENFHVAHDALDIPAAPHTCSQVPWPLDRLVPLQVCANRIPHPPPSAYSLCSLSVHLSTCLYPLFLKAPLYVGQLSPPCSHTWKLPCLSLHPSPPGVFSGLDEVQEFGAGVSRKGVSPGDRPFSAGPSCDAVPFSAFTLP